MCDGFGSSAVLLAPFRPRRTCVHATLACIPRVVLICRHSNFSRLGATALMIRLGLVHTLFQDESYPSEQNMTGQIRGVLNAGNVSRPYDVEYHNLIKHNSS